MTTDAKLQQTPDQFIDMYSGRDQISHEMRSNADEFFDLERGINDEKGFSRRDFQEMILLTYQEYYGKFKDQFNPHEFIDCVENEKLVTRFGENLDNVDGNVLTRNTHPWLDLGEIPDTHSFMRSESDQTFYVPAN